MKIAILLAALSLPAFSSLALAADLPEMPPGLWEMKMKTEIRGMPQMASQMPFHTMTHCVKPGQRKWTDHEKSPMERGDSKCKQTDIKVDGNKIAWKMACGNGTTGEGVITHNGKDAYQMDSVMNVPQMGTIKSHVDGRKIADSCDK
jgi:hypothetical protein